MGPSARTSDRSVRTSGPGGGRPTRHPVGLRLMARKKSPPISAEDRRVVGRMLRDLRRAAGYASVEAASVRKTCPAAQQTIYAYERGGLTPSLPQFLELVEFYVLRAAVTGDGAKPESDLRAQGV